MSNLKSKLAQKFEMIQANSTTSTNYISDTVKEAPDNIIVLSPQNKNEAVSIIPDFVVSLEQAKQRISMLQRFVKEMMIPGIDYGLIPRCDKPTLFKSGAEKLTDISGFSKQFEVNNRIEDWDKVLFHYEVKAILTNKRTGLIEAEGLGCCNNRERKYKFQDGFSIINTILKMAKKRALVDAVLSATRSSGMFTQDIEDTDNNYAQSSKDLSTQSTGKTNNSNDNSNEITSNVYASQANVKITKEQQTKLVSIMNERKLLVEDIRMIMNQRYQVTESKYLSSEQADDFIEYLKVYNVL